MNRLSPRSHLLFEFMTLVLWVVLAAVLPGLSIPYAAGPLAVWIIVLAAARVLGLGSGGARWVLSAAMALTGILLLINLSYFNSSHGATPDAPYLVNYDADRTWGYAHGYADGSNHQPLHNWGAYGWLMSPFARFGGLCGMLSFSALMTMLSILFTGRIASLMSGDDSDEKTSRRLAVVAMAMLALVGNYLTAGTIIIKDALVCAGFSALALGTLELRRGPEARAFAGWTAFMVVFAVLLFIVRTRANLMIFLIILFLVPFGRAGLRRWLGWAAALAVCVAVSAAVSHYSIDMKDSAPEAVRQISTQVFVESPRGSVLSSFISAYPALPLWQRLAALPFTMGLQLFIPLPWTFMRHIDYGPSLILAHFNFFLYLEAGLVLFFIFSALRRAPRPLAALTLAGLVLYAGVAFLFGGSVTRYTLPVLPLLIPAAAYVAVECRTARMVRWMALYTSLVIIALVAGWILYSLAPAANDIYC